MKNKFIISFIIILLLFPLSFIMLTLLPSYTIIADVDITVWAYSKQVQKLGYGTIGEICSVKRVFSIFDFFYSIKNVWTIKRKYYYTETIETHDAIFSIKVKLFSNSIEKNWTSNELNINHADAHLASTKIIIRNVKPGNYSLNIILFLDNEIEDEYNSKIYIP